MSELPAVFIAQCPTCGERVIYAMELIIGTSPIMREGITSLPYVEQVTVLESCHHWEQADV